MSSAIKRPIAMKINAMAKMGKNQPVSVEVLAKICQVLDCSVDEIFEFLPDEPAEQ